MSMTGQSLSGEELYRIPRLGGKGVGFAGVEFSQAIIFAVSFSVGFLLMGVLGASSLGIPLWAISQISFTWIGSETSLWATSKQSSIAMGGIHLARRLTGQTSFSWAMQRLVRGGAHSLKRRTFNGCSRAQPLRCSAYS
jgi:hypothetical protein